MSQLGQKSAKLVADYLMLPVEEQVLVFSALSKHQQHNVFQPFPLFASMSPQPQKLPQPQQENVWENNEGLQIVKETPIPFAAKKSKRLEAPKEYEAEPIEQFCIQVCDADECVCRYKASKEEQEQDYVPDLDLNGLYVFSLRRGQGYPYIAKNSGLTMRPNDNRIRVVGGKGVAYVNMANHEQAVRVYKNLRMNGVRVNWQKTRKSNDNEEEEQNQ
jgi:hypothetical protein